MCKNANAIQISNFVFNKLIIDCFIYNISNIYYLDITNFKDFFEGAQIVKILFQRENPAIVNYDILINNNCFLLKLPFKINTLFQTCTFEIVKKYNVHVNEINRLHYIEKKYNDCILVKIMNKYSFNSQTICDIQFIQSISAPSNTYPINTNVRTLEVKELIIPQVNNISETLKNNLFSIMTEIQPTGSLTRSISLTG